jgi:hypothetical protein
LAAILLLLQKTHFMKKIVLSLFLSFVVFSVFNLLSPNAISNPTGAPAGNTGSPSDGTTCAESCHGGSAVTQAGLITSTIPTAGYTPGTTYTITASISGSGNKGFQVSPQNTAGTLLGSLIAGTGSQIVGIKYVTHSSAKSSTAASWTFQWIAPAAGTGSVTFYGAFAITQNSTKKSTLVVNEAVVVALPVITNFTPTSALVGTTVTITGTGFTGATSVKFGGTAASSFNVVNATTIQAIVANGATGDVSVTTAAGTATKAGFVFVAAPTITNFTPTTAASGATVTITGTGFTGATAVNFGGTAASSFNVINATSIQAVIGTGATGDVSVITPAGTATTAGFVFVVPPTITQFTPTAAKSGETVTILGTNFTNASAVRFGGVNAMSFTIQNDNLITAVVAGGASGDILVVTPNGNASLAGFTFLKTIKIKSFYPDSAKTNDTISITGENFSEVIAVTFGGTAASSFTILNDTMILAAVGAGSTGDIGLSDKSGMVNAPGFVYLAVPRISSFSPTTAKRDELVTIYGNELLEVSNVLFGGVACNSFTVISNTQLEARVGNGNSGNVTVVGANGSDSKSGFIFATSIGINQQGNSNGLLKAYPNPANNSIQIQIPISSTNSKITIYNLLGEEIFTNEIAAQTNAIFINLNDWKAGSYIIRWNNQTTTLSSSFLKTN